MRTSATGVPVRLGDVAHLQMGPELRRGIAELDGEGEVTGGIIVMRSGKNALATIEAVKKKMEPLKASLPPGVEIVETYDRSGLINRSVDNLTGKLIEEFIVVALVCFAFLFHLRSALVAIVSLPLGVLMAFIVMRYQGVNANIMSLGGIAIAIGAMVDAAIVMIENLHKHLERWRDDNTDASPMRANAGRSSPRPACRWGRRCSSACSSSPCRSFPSSRSRRRKDGCSLRWRTPRLMRWRRPQASR